MKPFTIPETFQFPPDTEFIVCIKQTGKMIRNNHQQALNAAIERLTVKAKIEGREVNEDDIKQLNKISEMYGLAFLQEEFKRFVDNFRVMK